MDSHTLGLCACVCVCWMPMQILVEQMRFEWRFGAFEYSECHSIIHSFTNSPFSILYYIRLFIACFIEMMSDAQIPNTAWLLCEILFAYHRYVCDRLWKRRFRMDVGLNVARPYLPSRDARRQDERKKNKKKRKRKEIRPGEVAISQLDKSASW